MSERITDYERHILWLIDGRHCMSLLDDRHPTVASFLDRGLATKSDQGLVVTPLGFVALGRTQGLER